ncbi:MAG: fasciclin domain-containing protein, partial [Flavobacteriales bacterium]
GIPTMNDDVLFVSIDGGSVMIGMANVIQADIEADNGVVHIIDMVLIPDSDPTGVETLFEGQDVEYLYTINLLGELVDRDSKEKILVDIYSNGTSIKRYNLRK